MIEQESVSKRGTTVFGYCRQTNSRISSARFIDSKKIIEWEREREGERERERQTDRECRRDL